MHERELTPAGVGRRARTTGTSCRPTRAETPSRTSTAGRRSPSTSACRAPRTSSAPTPRFEGAAADARDVPEPRRGGGAARSLGRAGVQDGDLRHIDAGRADPGAAHFDPRSVGRRARPSWTSPMASWCRPRSRGPSNTVRRRARGWRSPLTPWARRGDGRIRSRDGSGREDVDGAGGRGPR